MLNEVIARGEGQCQELDAVANRYVQIQLS